MPGGNAQHRSLEQGNNLELEMQTQNQVRWQQSREVTSPQRGLGSWHVPHLSLTTGSKGVTQELPFTLHWAPSSRESFPGFLKQSRIPIRLCQCWFRVLTRKDSHPSE